MRVRMKNLMGIMEGGSLPTMSNLEEAMKAEQKVIMFYLLYLTVYLYLHFVKGTIKLSENQFQFP